MYGPPCPTGGEAHGSLVQMPSGNWHCPHFEHDTPKAHSRSTFTDAEATRSQMAHDGFDQAPAPVASQAIAQEPTPPPDQQAERTALTLW